MRTKIDSRLCDTSFWDNNSTWYAQKPTFSYCFMDTALVWLPACFLLFAVIKEFMNCREAKIRGLKPIPLNLFNRSRLFVTFLLFVLSLSETFYNGYTLIRGLTEHRPDESSVEESVTRVVSISTLIAPIIKLFSYLVLLVIYFKQRRAGLHTSASIWSYLLISVICDALSFYTVIVIFKQEQDFDVVRLVVELIHFPLIMLLFILECRGDTLIVDPDLTDIRPDSPELQASFCSSIVFWWFNGFLLFGYRSRLKLTNLWKTLSRDKASGLAAVFRGTWARPTKSSKKTAYQAASGNVQQTNNIIFVLAKLFSPKLFSAASLKFLQDILQYVTPLLLKRLLYYMSSKNEPEWHGTLFAISLLVVPTLQSLILGTYFYKMQLIGLQIRTMIIGSIYRKALLLSGSSRMQSTSGEIVNLMAVDTQRFQDVLLYVNLIWSAPFQIILAVILLYRELGWSVFAGVGCMALMLPANAFLANRIKFSQIKLMKTKDERIKQMNELLGGIRVIKLYAWENSFISNLLGFRNRELEHLKHILTLDAVQTFLWQCSPFVVSLVTFAVYVHEDPANVLNAQKAFVSISLFNLLRFPLTMLPSLVTSLVLTIVSARRLNKFLNNDELVKYVTRNEELEAIAIEGGTLSWSQDKEGHSPERAVLKDIDLHIKPNTFVAILGQVASGKSSLLAAILGEMHRIAGRFNILQSMKVAYVPQQAWIQNMSLKENIIFGSPFNEEKYKQVLSVCSLESDLATLPGGDQAEIGEKGINLSGGQKQRVSLARACYSESDIFLLDDPLSALDSHVAKHVFDKVLSSSSGILKNKTRVLATNSLFVLPYVDQIVVLDEGRIVESGTYKELMAKDKGYLTEMMRQYSGNDEELEMQKTDASDENEEPTKSPEIVPGNEGILKSETQAIGADIGKLIEVEKVETGSVGYTVYLAYFKAVSILWLLAVLISLVSSASFNVATNIWLSMWSSDAEKDELPTDDRLKTLRLIVYAILGGLQCLSVLLGSLALSRGAVRAAHHLHSSLLERVMHSPMVFFDTTPIGRIVNRFAKDIDVVDSTLPGTSRSWLNCFLQVVSTMFVICYSFPSFLIIIIPLGIIYYLIQKIFIVTTRQLKRLESTTRSPIYSHFSETLSGINTIRAYNSADRFISLSDNLVDRNQSCSYPNIIANRWLSVRLEFFGNLITACAALFSVYHKGAVGAEVAGLTISYSLSITQTLSWLVRMTSDLETHIVSVERILEYMLNKQEDFWIKSERPSPDWPTKGAIQIEDYSTRYRDETDLVLRNINIDIKPREKIGIVGRTGSGKSSLSLSLFRILEPASGRIMIDQLDIVKYGLHDIRSKLTIIPQDPVLFSGTLRFNLDPLQLHSDMEIWRALELAHLRAYMSSLESGLDYKVIEYGENFSVGQRQLICLARAILRKSKILILDEATASVDLETDSIVQKTIRDIFDDCTIITIAHRLHTILDSDRILVLDKGYVKELDKSSAGAGKPRASEVFLQSAKSIAFNQNGELFIGESEPKLGLNRVLLVSPEEDTISIHAGSSSSSTSGDHNTADNSQQLEQQQSRSSNALGQQPLVRATDFKLASVAAIAVDQKGRLIVADELAARLVSVEPDLPQMNALGEFELLSPDNPDELLVFNRNGYHVATRDVSPAAAAAANGVIGGGGGHVLRAANKFTFGYDLNTPYARLTSVSYATGNKISIHREGPQHTARLIETAFGGQCKLDITRNGQINSIAVVAPNSSKTNFAYQVDGGLLKQSRSQASGDQFEFTYDDFGRATAIQHSSPALAAPLDCRLASTNNSPRLSGGSYSAQLCATLIVAE